MSPPSKLRGVNSIVEPPRDGEFFFDESVIDEPVTYRSRIEQFGDFIQQNPLVALGTAVAVGALITSMFMM